MIQVSNEFKKAIKEPERRIKGYVEVLYDLPNVSITPTTNMTSTYTPTSEISNGIRVENLYGSVDYLPLDGSYITMDTTNTNIGFISDDLFEDLTNPTITLSFSSTTVKGITMYFRNNTPTNLTINYSDETSDTITNNENDIVQVIFSEQKTLTSVEVVINDVMYPDRKIYCMEIDLGVTQVYKDQDLIEFTVDEEVNKLVEEVPVNETNIILNNMTDLFNPLNPKGIVPYLSENTLIKPYIGVLTENLGVEYVKMGEFYFDSYTNNSDATTTLVGKNIIKQLSEETIIDDNETNLFNTFLVKSDMQTYLQNYNYIINKFDWKRNISLVALQNNSLINLLKDMNFYQDNLFYANRENQLNFNVLNMQILDTLTKTELINDVEYKNIDKINTIKVIKKSSTAGNNVSSREIVRESVILQKQTEIFLFKSDSPNLITATVSQSGGTSATIISQGMYYAFVKVVGTIGNTVTIILSSTANRTNTEIQYELTNKGSEKEVSLTFDSPVNFYAIANTGYIKNSDILSRTPSYEMRFDYNGDPSLEAGDYINVETPYGYKKLFIQKNRFKFDGGLEGSIEGVE